MHTLLTQSWHVTAGPVELATLEFKQQFCPHDRLDATWTSCKYSRQRPNVGRAHIESAWQRKHAMVVLTVHATVLWAITKYGR